MSAEQIARPKSPGKASGEVRWHGRQSGRVKLADRQLKVERRRLRRKGGGEEAVPAYEALRKSKKTGEEMFETRTPSPLALHKMHAPGSITANAGYRLCEIGLETKLGMKNSFQLNISTPSKSHSPYLLLLR